MERIRIKKANRIFGFGFGVGIKEDDWNGTDNFGITIHIALWVIFLTLKTWKQEQDEVFADEQEWTN